MSTQHYPMLASSGPATDEAARDLAKRGFIFDMKWDGVRAIAVVEDDHVQLLNRKGEDFAYRYPEITGALVRLHKRTRDSNGHRLVLDGEIVIFDPETGKPQFGLTGQRSFGPARWRDIAAAALRMPATFVTFDVLEHGGEDIRSWPLSDRLVALEELLPAAYIGDGRVRQSVRNANGEAMLNIVRSQRLEGVIAKRLGAPYRAGRSSDWVKMKPTRTCTAIVTGWEPGEGKRADTFGALHLAVLSEAGEKVNIGKVGTGFSDVELATMDPFVKAGQEFYVEVEYLDRQPKTGVLRFPVFVGVRWDLARHEVNEQQLPPIPR